MDETNNNFGKLQKKHHMKFITNSKNTHLLAQNEPRHDKTNKMAVRPVKTQISLGIRPVWSESSLSAWRKLGSLATHWAHSEDSDQIGRMPRLIQVFAGRTLILLILACRGSNNETCNKYTCIYHYMNKK